MQANYNESDIRSLLSKVKIFNNNLGEYQLFAINSSFDYVVKLSNGTIFFTVEELQANMNDQLTPEMLSEIAKRFGAKENVEASPTSTPQPEQKQESKKITSSIEDQRVQQYRRNTALMKNIVWAGIAVIAIIGILFAVNIYNDHSVGDTFSDEFYNESATTSAGSQRPKTEEELRLELKERERNNPVKFISAEWSTKEKFLLSQRIFEGRIYNTATATGFKNIRFRISGYSDTDYKVDERDYVITEFIDAGDHHDFKLRTEIWDNDISRFEIQVVNAEWY